MKRKISLSTLLLLGALPLGAIAAEPARAPADSGTPSDKSAGQYIDDAALITKVKAALVRDKTVKASEVKVDVYKGNVQLSGFAGSSAEVDRAVQIAREVPGVKSVHNDIRLK